MNQGLGFLLCTGNQSLAASENGAQLINIKITVIMPTEYSKSIFQLASLFSALFVECNAHSVLFFFCVCVSARVWGGLIFLWFILFFIFGRMKIFPTEYTKRKALASRLSLDIRVVCLILMLQFKLTKVCPILLYYLFANTATTAHPKKNRSDDTTCCKIQDLWDWKLCFIITPIRNGKIWSHPIISNLPLKCWF